MMTVEQASVVKDNLYLVFGEADAAKRKQAIERLWAHSNDSVFVAPDGVVRGHGGISNVVDIITATSAAWKFQHKGEHNPGDSTRAQLLISTQESQEWYLQMAMRTPAS